MRKPFLLLLLLALCSCVGADSDQARICRGVLAALHSPGTEIGVSSVSAGERPHAIAIRYETRLPPNPPRERTVECRYGGGFLSRDRLDLTAVLLDGRPMPEANFVFLKRFWVDDPATIRLQPPRSQAERAGAPDLPPQVAIVLQHALLALPPIAIYCLLAPAYALIYGLIGRINLAFGELAVIGGQGALLGAVAGGVISDGSPAVMLGASLLLALAAAATHSEAMGRHVIGPLANGGGQPILVATAGLSAALMEYVRLSQEGGVRWTPPLLGTPIVLFESGDFAVTVSRGALVFSGLAFTACVGLLLYLRMSRYGREWRATAEEPVAAALLGIDTRAVLLRAMTLSGLLAGLAGFVITAQYGGVGFAGGLGIGLKALIAAILGGIGSVPGAMLGALALGAFESAWSAFLPLHLREMAVFTLLVLLLVFRPGGLLGFAGRDATRDGALR